MKTNKQLYISLIAILTILTTNIFADQTQNEYITYLKQNIEKDNLILKNKQTEGEKECRKAYSKNEMWKAHDLKNEFDCTTIEKIYLEDALFKATNHNKKGE